MRTMSLSWVEVACLARIVPSRSTRWTVPGMAVGSRWIEGGDMLGCMLLLKECFKIVRILREIDNDV